MSAWKCDKCGQEYWDTHECPNDGEAILKRIRDLESKVQQLADKLEINFVEEEGPWTPR